MKIKNLKNRNLSIDLLKAVAIFLIINSHSKELFPNSLSIFATGGAIGDALFFFASGYTLLLGVKQNNFFDWYKRRINRIYPSVFAWSFISSLLFGSDKTMFQIILYGGGWFVRCIMVFYILFYYIKKRMIIFLPHLFAATIIIILFWYALIYEKGINLFDTKQYLIKFIFFLFMLQGAICGYKSQNQVVNPNLGYALVKLVVGVSMFYGIQIASRNGIIPEYLVILSYAMLLLVIHSLYQIGSSIFISEYLKQDIISKPIYTISMLCLEVYLCQFSIIPIFTSISFPVNYFLLYPSILIVAYVTKILSNLFTMIFTDSALCYKRLLSV